MNGSINQMGVLFWSQLTPEQAMAMTGEWESRREARLSWLADQVQRPLMPDPEDLDVCWEWFLRWRHQPVSASSQPTPEWWREWRGVLNHRGEDMAANQKFERDEAVGLDALGHLFEEVVRRACPKVERWYVGRGPAQGPWVDRNHPCLGVRRSRPWKDRTHEDVADVMSSMRRWGEEWADPWRERRPVNPRIAFDRSVENYQRALTASPPPTLAERVATEPPFEWIREPSDPDYPYQFGFNDDISTAHQGLMTDFMAALRQRAGIRAVAHLDRELIGVAGKIKVRELRQWAWDWWKARIPKDEA